MSGKKGVKYSEINAQPTSSAKEDLVQKEIRRVTTPCLSDALINRGVGGQRVLLALDEASKNGVYDPNSDQYLTGSLKWKLKKFQNRDGSIPKPGDQIRVLFARNYRDSAKRKLSGMEIEDRKRRGEKGFERYHVYELDSDLCFECGFQDALQLLTQAGVHYETRLALNSYKERSAGGLNWLYEEIVEGVNEPKRSVETQIKK
jgi:hypothetical protein